MNLFRETFLIFFTALLSCHIATAQLLAFQGADGFGKYASGGRGGKIISVTNLDDSGTGSFREAAEDEGARIIIFRISGTIYLKSPLVIKNANVTIAGQTAPGDGITLAVYPLEIRTENVIIRYIRCRLGDAAKYESDAFTVMDSKDVIVDHCSFSWSVDEAASCYKNTNFTMQWCLIAESLDSSAHHKGPHGYGGIWGGNKASFHHNLLAHHTSRNPRFNGARYKDSTWNEQVDFRNNVIYNWGFNSAYGGDPSEIDGNKAHINMVSNYYKPGPATKFGMVHFRILNPYPMKNYGYSLWFVNGNFMEGNRAVTSNNKLGIQEVPDSMIDKILVDKPFGFEIEATETPENAYESVLNKAGMRFPQPDAVDKRILTEVAMGLSTFGRRGIINSQSQVGGWPVLKSLPYPQDSDHDGIPDVWEEANGLNKNNSADASGIGKSGYSNIEVYINSLVQ